MRIERSFNWLALILPVACSTRSKDTGWEGSGSLEPFPINLVVLLDAPNAPGASSLHADPYDPSLLRTGEELLRREVDILNEYFVASDGGPVCDDASCISFAYRSHWFYDEISDTSCDLLEFGSMQDVDVLKAGDYGAMDDAVLGCADERLVDPTAINFYVIDRCVWDETTETVDCTNLDSHGTSNEDDLGLFHPLIALDIARLQHQTASPEEHEMGHALGLRHVCDPAVTRSTDDSNIMQQHCENESGACQNAGAGGARNLGFGEVEYDVRHCEFEQVRRLMRRAHAIQDQW